MFFYLGSFVTLSPSVWTLHLEGQKVPVFKRRFLGQDRSVVRSNLSQSSLADQCRRPKSDSNHFEIAASIKLHCSLFAYNGLESRRRPSSLPLRRIMTKWRHSAKETLKKKESGGQRNERRKELRSEGTTKPPNERRTSRRFYTEAKLRV